MARNPDRRIVLIDAAIDVLAREGARGLTFRAVDAEAGAPTGTASNYFPDRDDLLGQVGRRIHVRLRPDDTTVAEATAMPPTAPSVAELAQGVVDRLAEGRPVYLALIELRLEATRRPALARVLSETIHANRLEDLSILRAGGMPGTDEEQLWVYLAVSGLILEELTLPGVLVDDPALTTAAMVRRLIGG